MPPQLVACSRTILVSLLHIDDGAVLVKRQHFDFALQNVGHFTHCFTPLASVQPHGILCTIIFLFSALRFRGNVVVWRMSALGQKRTFRSAIAMSALPPKASECAQNVR
jgi:hypothetical protein